MEKQLFDWDGFDQQDTAAFSFYKVTLKCKIGRFEAGMKFDSAFVDYENGTLALYVGDKEYGKFNLELTVKE